MKFLVLIGAAQGLFLSLALFFKKEKHGKFLSLLLFLFTIELFTEFLAIDVKSNADLTYFNIPVFLLENAIFLLYGPVFYFYVSFITTEKEKLKRKDLIHFIPFIIFFLILTGIFIHIAVTGIENLKDSKESKVELIFSAIVNIAFYLQVLVYIYFSRKAMNNYKKRILQNFSDIHKISCKWLSILIYAISFAWAATFFFYIMHDNLQGNCCKYRHKCFLCRCTYHVLFTRLFYSFDAGRVRQNSFRIQRRFSKK